MATNCESHEQYKMDAAEMKYRARHGAKSAAFLLIIPGSAIMGFGIGLLTGHVFPGTTVGFGAGLLLWGLIVALTK